MSTLATSGTYRSWTIEMISAGEETSHHRRPAGAHPVGLDGMTL
jgi:hypothetical protein